jgi:hypothetical protein
MAFSVRAANWVALEETLEALRRRRRPQDAFDRFMRTEPDGTMREPGQPITGDLMDRTW